MKRTLGGPPNSVGWTHEWAGNSDAGSGKMEVANSTAPSKIEVKLDFTQPFESRNFTEFARAKGDVATGR